MTAFYLVAFGVLVGFLVWIVYRHRGVEETENAATAAPGCCSGGTGKEGCGLGCCGGNQQARLVVKNNDKVSTQ